MPSRAKRRPQGCKLPFKEKNFVASGILKFAFIHVKSIILAQIIANCLPFITDKCIIFEYECSCTQMRTQFYQEYKMKKVSKVLVLLLVAVMVLSIFSGCGVFSRNNEKYRATAALQVGNETITIGKIIDTFNNYYNSYYSYISQGYVTVDDVFDIAMTSLYTQYMKLDAYKTTPNVPTYTHAGTDFANQQYIDDEEYAFSVKYVKHIVFTGLDSVVEGYIKNDYELNDKEEEDTSRDFIEYDDLSGCDTYSEYVYRQNFVDEDMDEYFADYYNGIATFDNVSVDEYVYQSESDAQAMLDQINDRIEGEEKITFTQYKQWQQDALKQYRDNVQNSYEYSLETLIERQIEDFIVSVITTKYDYSVYKAIDGADLQETISQLTSTYEKLKANQTASFNINSNFVSFIEGLTDSSYIYTVPEGYNYIFVKNILIPFTSEQKTVLSNLQKQLGSDTDPRYIAKRTEFAAEVVAEDFLHQDGEGENVKVENLFTTDDQGNVVVNADGALGSYFGSDGKVIPMQGKTADETVIELMKQYNTDTAQHSKVYDYVVRVGEVPDSYTSSWVQEFVDAANVAYDLATAAGATGGYYGVAVSTYGVHIVYYSAKVEAQTFDFETNLLNSTTPEYRTFKTYFETKSSDMLEDALDALKEAYYPTKIVKSNEFDKFLKENKLTYDLQSALDLSKEEEAE